MTIEQAKQAGALNAKIERAERLFDHISLLREGGGQVVIDFHGEATALVQTYEAERDTELLIALQNGLQDLIFNYEQQINEL